MLLRLAFPGTDDLDFATAAGTLGTLGHATRAGTLDPGTAARTLGTLGPATAVGIPP
jgi:hypothetical protein